MSDAKVSELELRFMVRSSHPRVSAAELVKQLTQEEPGLNDHLHQQFKGLNVEIRREESFPVELGVAWLVLKFVGGAAAAGFFKQAGSDAYTYLKQKVRNGSIEPADATESQKEGGDAKMEPADGSK